MDGIRLMSTECIVDVMVSSDYKFSGIEMLGPILVVAPNTYGGT